MSALILVQMLLGVITAHYGVEGDGFYGFPLSEWLPYSVSRTWHVQMGLFWIATAWLAAGLFIGPLVSGAEPKGQQLGVNVLFGALLLVGLLQTKASVEHSYWYARSSEFMQTDLMQTLRWMRVPGDTVFFLGAVALVLFVAGLKTGHSFKNQGQS